jgi:hypothetical protein
MNRADSGSSKYSEKAKPLHENPDINRDRSLVSAVRSAAWHED